MYIQGVDSVYDLVWSEHIGRVVTYGDVYLQNEKEQSAYNFEHANTEELFRTFDSHEKQAEALSERGLSMPAYEHVLGASHTFNLLDARNAISVTERQRYILRIRQQARRVAEAYYASRETLGFPLINNAAECAE